MRTLAATAAAVLVVLLGPAGCGATTPAPGSGPDREPSSGPTGVVTVPRIAEGTSYDDAVRRLDARGLEVAEVDFPGPFYVVGTRPAAGTRVPAGSTVDLLLGEG